MSVSEHYPYRSADARERYLEYYDGQAQSWPLDSETRMVRTSDGETFVRVSGRVDAPPLVLLPGGRSSSLCWSEMIEALSQRFRTYAVDGIYDVGRSVPTAPTKTTDDLTGWIDRLLDGLGLTDGISLMGLSFGAYSSAEYLLRSPERIRQVVWVSPAAIALDLSPGFIFRSLPCLVPSAAAFGSFTRWIMPGLVGQVFDESIHDMVMGARCYVMRTWPGRGPRKLSDAELEGIDVPALYVAGSDDRVCRDVSEAAARLDSLMPNVETTLVPGVGHDLFMLDPGAVSQRALAFLAD